MSEEELKAVAELRRENAEAHAETRRHVDVAFERVDSKLEMIAESFMTLRDMMVRGFERAEETRERDTAELKAMIKFSHADLDLRVRTLEEGQRNLQDAVADLQTRLARVESTTS